MRKLLLVPVLFLLSAGCEDEIGDGCGSDADCSQNMDRNCDRTQPGGYCLEIGCGPGECPSESVCVEFTTPCPSGMDPDECQLIEPNRGRTYCLKHCRKDSHCRSRYICAAPEEFSASIIEFETSQTQVCVPNPDS